MCIYPKRSEKLSLSTIDGDTIQFKVLASFMKEKFPYLNSFSAVDEGKIIGFLKDWMLNNGYKITCNHRMKTANKVIVEECLTDSIPKETASILEARGGTAGRREGYLAAGSLCFPSAGIR